MKAIKWSFHFFFFYIFSLIIQQVHSNMCHSSCAPGDTTSLACAINNDPTQCKNCYSNNVMFYPTPATAGTARECVPNATNNAHLNIDKLQFINGATTLGVNYLKSFLVGVTLFNTADTLSNLLLFSGINNLFFDVATFPVITFNFLGLGTDHYAVYIRVNAMTNCSSSPLFKISVGVSVRSSPLVANNPTMIETNLINHVTDGLNVVL